MTTIKDTYHTWTIAAFDYIRDQLRANPTIGIGKHPDGAHMIEVGDVTLLELIMNHPQERSIWITPGKDRIVRKGGDLEHHIRVTVNVFQVAPLQPHKDFADAQTAFRDYWGKVFNETLELRDAGFAAGHWSDWWPEGDVEPVALGNVEHDRAVLAAAIPFHLWHDRQWIQGV